MRRSTLVLALASLGVSGCIAPIALPPLELGGGSGLAKPSSAKVQPNAQISVSTRPAAAFASARDRPVDVGLGFHWERNRTDALYGPTLDARGFVLSSENEGDRGRLALGFEGRLLFASEGRRGQSGALQLLVDYGSFVKAACGSSFDRKGGAAGCAVGEYSAGAVVEASYGEIGGVQFSTVGLSLLVRTPAFAGVFAATK